MGFINQLKTGGHHPVVYAGERYHIYIYTYIYIYIYIYTDLYDISINIYILHIYIYIRIWVLEIWLITIYDITIIRECDGKQNTYIYIMIYKYTWMYNIDLNIC